VTLRIEVHDRIADVGREDWNGLVQAAGAPIFYTHDFLHAYETAPLQGGLACLYMIVRDAEGRACAALPVYVQESMDLLGVLAKADPALGEGNQRGLLTHFWHCYDTRIAGELSPGLVEVVCSALADLARARGAGRWGFVNVDPRGELYRHLVAAGFAPVHIWDRFFLPLSGWSSADEYVAALPRKSRHEMRRQCRRAAEAGVSVSVLAPPWAGLEELEEVAALCRSTTSKFGSVPYYPETFAEFLGRVGAGLRILTLRLKGELVGAWICFLEGSCLHTWAAGANYDLETFSPYYVGFYEAVRFAFEHGAALLEGGRGNAWFKERYGMQGLPLYALLGSA
jgi:predicted N-acyltransferase